jgi:hypothetical protein
MPEYRTVSFRAAMVHFYRRPQASTAFEMETSIFGFDGDFLPTSEPELSKLRL